MLEMEIRQKLLVDELQLGTRLNEAVSSGNRADFALMLSMISQDVTDDASVVDPVKTQPVKEDLRARFSLAPVRSFYADEHDGELEDALKDAVDRNDRAATNFLLATRSEPLALLEEILDRDVLNNLSPVSRMKAQREEAGTALVRVPYDLTTLAIVDAVRESRDFLHELIERELGSV